MTNKNLIHLEHFDENVLQTVQSIISHGVKSVYDLKSTKQRLGEDDMQDYVFLTMYNNHASIVRCDYELYEHWFKTKPKFGDIIRPKVDQTEEWVELTEVPMVQFHVIFDPIAGKYFLTVNLYYYEWFTKATHYFCGTTGLPLFNFQILCLMTVHEKYQLLQHDCLTVAIKIIEEVICHEEPENLEKFQAIARNLTITGTRLEKWMRDWLPGKVVNITVLMDVL